MGLRHAAFILQTHVRISRSYKNDSRKPGQIFYFISKTHIHRLRLTKIAELYLQRVVEKGGVFHVWGHSWEIEQPGLWGQLEEIFKIPYKISNVTYLTNSQLVDVNGEK